jgi:uncharacterized membrane protein HdeD (DUF308 family)
VAALGRSWRWAHALFGVFMVGAGVVALAWPEATFIALAAVIGWFLLFQGTLDVVVSLFVRFQLWWLRLVVGLAGILIAFWPSATRGGPSSSSPCGWGQAPWPAASRRSPWPSS